MAESSIVLITGGNTGIGYESVKALYASPQPHTVLMGSRSLEKAHNAISKLKSEVPDSKSQVEPIQIDIEDDDSIQKAFEHVKSKYGRLDALVNNAGGSFDYIMHKDSSPKTIREAWNKTYSVNVTSTEVVTQTFAPLLIAASNARLLFITSGISSLERCAGGADSKNRVLAGDAPKGWPKPPKMTPTAYRTSKTALNMMVLSWDMALAVDGVKVFNISPGFLATNIGGVGADHLKEMGAGHPSIGGEFIKDVVEGKRDEDTGKVINKDGVQPW